MQTPVAKIYQPAKTAMQSGRAKTRRWLLQYKAPAPTTPDGLMGWNTMSDTRAQINLAFDSKEAAIAYANAKNIPFEVQEPQKPAVAPKAYAENFSHGRRTAFEANS